MRSEISLPISEDDSLPKADRLFRSAISSYCALTRPAGRDAAQLDDLTLPLLPLVSEESKRYAAAALSEVHPAPPTLLRRLADCPVAISAPLLLRSPALADIDLIGLIGRNGLAHARAIGRRARLNPNISALIAALGVASEAETRVEPAPARPVSSQAAERPQEARPRGEAEEETRRQLRAMMKPAEPAPTPAPAVLQGPAPLDWSKAHAAYARMVTTGLTGKAALFQTAIADAFDISFDAARDMVELYEGERLAVALKAAGLETAQAFFVSVLAFPPRFAGTAAIRTFVETFRGLDIKDARAEVEAWRARSPRVRLPHAPAQPANVDRSSGVEPRRLLKAS